MSATLLKTEEVFSCPAPFAALEAEITQHQTLLRAAITDAYRRDEREAVQWMLSQAVPDEASTQAAQALARQLIVAVRSQRARASGVDALMQEFSLSSEEGIALMCLAEALLRIPDKATADRLIADKISRGNWRKHLGESPSLFVNAATWGLLITGKLMATHTEQGLGHVLARLIAKGGEPLIRKGVDLAMRMLGNQFVTGQTIEEALANSRERETRGYRFSYDMLGEAALTAEDADRYFTAYEHAIHAIGDSARGRGIRNGPGISVKLSALHPRYARAQRARVMQELLPRLKQLLHLAKCYDIGLNIDAEEADRLELSLDLMESLAFDPDLAGFDGIGFVVQAYQKRCPFVIDYLVDLARRSGHRFMLRLVKGAYWDAEIKRAQVDGLSGYPVYTRKVYTDVSYLACAQKLLDASDAVYPQFATHNAQTLATVYGWSNARGITDYEFQCLHGMGETLYDQVVGTDKLDRPCRIYAPVGSHETLLAYLVRRLLENGANSSFVNQVVNDRIPTESLLADPFARARELDGQAHPRIPLPADLFGKERRNSAGIDWSNEQQLWQVGAALQSFGAQQWQAAPLLAVDVPVCGDMEEIRNPADRHDLVGQVTQASRAELESALAAAQASVQDWQNTSGAERAQILMKAADLLETHRLELMALAIREAGKTLPNALSEVREAVDFLRYYAAQVRESELIRPLGPVACISPWNFPLAIFIGEVSAALAAGNVVLAKPAEQTPLIAHRAVQLLHEAGVPRSALQFLPGRGEEVGAHLISDARVLGVIFTGSTEVAQSISRSLAARTLAEGNELPLIAETGGQNAMIVDSSALPEQVVQDAITSAFDSAGQRCSALRVLCLQSEIADKVLAMLQGAMRELCIGNPDRLSTDIGPVINREAQQALLRHLEKMRAAGKKVYQLPLPPGCAHGTFVAPAVIEIAALDELEREVFGPVLHVLRYRREELPQLVDAINATGYGLTLGIHSRIDETIEYICAHARVGNIYVNRNIIGAVVGVQPFGGEGKSGTGPKAGGPLYLKRLQREAQPIFEPSFTRPDFTAPALDALATWARSHRREELVALCEHYRETSPLALELQLPGPTGERNSLSLVPRGAVLCAADDLDGLLNQVAAVFAAGNQAVLAKADSLPADLPQAVLDSVRFIDDVRNSEIALRMALVDSSRLPAVLPLLALRNGALVPVVETEARRKIALWRLVAEHALCINTAAAGGNARLLTLEN
ncbi:trifunctional transcriptional regulator/proline dehydrogenase/L-glutamate gamma-semialdehyde dehydrogenase [Noviherbaspirillum massiliense]|uniref:trifunctional transcriptional regulator/proline dehydrogenase/L-glutamate gamma-semialdehyde dehydrogenase n=1 Tax=Noviherbaspirillum massiliense TaxID=1465823 RepID=UPI00030A6DBD|nr:trifunctional transcriptional regulator/proline dehydrogenase/L-glutamate gamma-semialdehyde dehydrogenase [Noviherbaspirillum massiliense]